MKKIFLAISVLISGIMASHAQKVWTLEDCIEYALTNNIDVKQQMLSIKNGEETLLQSKLVLLPDLNGYASHGYNWGQTIDQYTNEFATARVRSNNFYLSSQFTIFNGLQQMNQIRKNEMDLMATKYSVDKFMDDVSMNIAAAYLQILYYGELKRVAEAQLDITQQQVDRTQKMVEAGTLARGDLLLIEAQLATEELIATKEVGQPINLEGTDLKITLVDESTVYYLEGRVPEGVQVGDVAQYFNAEGRNCFCVVSWTGNEVEWFKGHDLSYQEVATGFNLPVSQPLTMGLENSGGGSWFQANPNLIKVVVAATMLVVIAFGAKSIVSGGSRRAASVPLQTVKLPAAAPKDGTTVSLRGVGYVVGGHAAAEIATAKHRYQQHEYWLKSEDGKEALLIYGFKPGQKTWTLFTPVAPPTAMSPAIAAAKTPGQTVQLELHQVQVREMFQASARPGQDGNPAVFFGFTAEDAGIPFLVRWDAKAVSCYMGSPVASIDSSANSK